MRYLFLLLVFLASCDVNSVDDTRRRGNEKFLYTSDGSGVVHQSEKWDAVSQFARCEVAAQHAALREEALAVGNTSMWMLPGLYAEYVACRRFYYRLQDLSQSQRIRFAGIVVTLRKQFESQLREIILYDSDLPVINYGVVRIYSDGDFTRDGRAGIVLDAMAYLAVEQMKPEDLGITFDQLVTAYQQGMKELYYHHVRYWVYGTVTNPDEYFGAKFVLCERILKQFQPLSTGLYEFDALLYSKRVRHPQHGLLPDQVESLECK